MIKHLKNLPPDELKAIKKEREKILASINKEREQIQERLKVLFIERIRATEKLRTVNHWIEANKLQKLLNAPEK